MELAAPANFNTANPGQFLHIRIENSSDPLLRRPLSIHDVVFSKKKSAFFIKVLYEVVGKGTALLAEKKPFSELDCLGPLGSGFDLKKILKFKTVYIVAGGMGVAPLFFLTRKIKECQNAKLKTQVKVLIGAKTKNDILREKEFEDLGFEVHIATDDGSKGFNGRVTDLLNKFLSSSIDHGPSSICACGPKPMLAAVTKIAQQNNMDAYVSLEEFMGCGLGACLGCVIRTTSGYKRICHDGPVFHASEIIWKE